MTGSMVLKVVSTNGHRGLASLGRDSAETFRCLVCTYLTKIGDNRFIIINNNIEHTTACDFLNPTE
jgi:hypothetical protein